jgi:carboxymethylenebutenolidase
VSQDAVVAESVSITGAGADTIEAYLARPLATGSYGGVVVIHHMPGYDAASKEITRRFAVMGYNAICPNLYWREAPGAAPDDAAAASRAAGGVPDDRLVGDVGGAAGYLRALTSANGHVGVIGYCSGGRQAFLAACSLPLDAAVDCYGAFVVKPPPSDSSLRVQPVVQLAGNLVCPLLGLFGAEDRNPAPDEVAELDRVLTESGKEHEFHVFENAGHGFFATDRAMYRPEAATKGWQLIDAFYAKHLSTR